MRSSWERQIEYRSGMVRWKRFVAAALWVVGSLWFGPTVAAQSADALWSGQVQCTLSVQSSGYSHQETQTWRLTGEPPRMRGSIAVYPATWTASSSGSGQRTVNAQITASQWKSSTTPISAPIGMFLRVNGALVIKSFHSLLSAPKATAITRQVSMLGTTPTVSTTQYAADEWIMPPIETTDATSGMSGSGTTLVGATAIPERAGGSAQTASCTWQFTKGSGSGSGTSSKTISPLPQQPLQLTIVPVISDVTPNTVLIGQRNLPVVITGSFTHFVNGLTTVDFGAPNLITVNSVNVTSPTTLTAYINVEQLGSTPFPGGKFNINVVTHPQTPLSVQQGVIVPADETASLAGAFTVGPQPIPHYNFPATFNPSIGQQGQSITVTITGSNTHFVQGVTQIQQSALSTSRISAPVVAVTSPTTATATFTILPTAITGTSQYTLVVTTNTAQNFETALGDFTITPIPDGFSHSQNPTSGVDIDTEKTQMFDGQLASISGEDWFWLECDTAACTIALQNVGPPTHIAVDVLNSQYLNVVASTDQQVSSLTQPPGSPMKIPGESAYYYLRVRATAWDLSHPKYSLVITGTPQ